MCQQICHTTFAELLSTLASGTQVAMSNGSLIGTTYIIDIKDRRGSSFQYATLRKAISASKSAWTGSQANLRPALVFKVGMAVIPQGSGGPKQFDNDIATDNPGDTSVPSMIYVKFPPPDSGGRSSDTT
ncbi:hypothetical protein BDD14_2210 [Edaphobacter modestus]|uniref:Uncharacterized protein n=1 Tax=Edaphobacter modestus TaxID=388466 RepID=A0A4V2G4F4_9BACT|nr:hypothetical protein BDD14_2210 [Edaphobacter modestus]